MLEEYEPNECRQNDALNLREMAWNLLGVRLQRTFRPCGVVLCPGGVSL